ncbi:hypothetical protein ACI79D_21575 [Geodermatophilus sp. SYSU D00708]
MSASRRPARAPRPSRAAVARGSALGLGLLVAGAATAPAALAEVDDAATGGADPRTQPEEQRPAAAPLNETPAAAAVADPLDGDFGIGKASVPVGIAVDGIAPRDLDLSGGQFTLTSTADKTSSFRCTTDVAGACRVEFGTGRSEDPSVVRVPAGSYALRQTTPVPGLAPAAGRSWTVSVCDPEEESFAGLLCSMASAVPHDLAVVNTSRFHTRIETTVVDRVTGRPVSGVGYELTGPDYRHAPDAGTADDCQAAEEPEEEPTPEPEHPFPVRLGSPAGEPLPGAGTEASGTAPADGEAAVDGGAAVDGAAPADTEAADSEAADSEATDSGAADSEATEPGSPSADSAGEDTGTATADTGTPDVAGTDSGDAATDSGDAGTDSGEVAAAGAVADAESGQVAAADVAQDAGAAVAAAAAAAPDEDAVPTTEEHGVVVHTGCFLPGAWRMTAVHTPTGYAPGDTFTTALSAPVVDEGYGELDQTFEQTHRLRPVGSTGDADDSPETSPTPSRPTEPTPRPEPAGDPAPASTDDEQAAGGGSTGGTTGRTSGSSTAGTSRGVPAPLPSPAAVATEPPAATPSATTPQRSTTPTSPHPVAEDAGGSEQLEPASESTAFEAGLIGFGVLFVAAVVVGLGLVRRRARRQD